MNHFIFSKRNRREKYFNLSKENWNNIIFEIVHEVWNHLMQQLKTIIKDDTKWFSSNKWHCRKNRNLTLFPKTLTKQTIFVDDISESSNDLIRREKRFLKTSLQKNSSTREVWIKIAFVGQWQVCGKIWKISIFLAYLSFYAKPP